MVHHCEIQTYQSDPLYLVYRPLFLNNKGWLISMLSFLSFIGFTIMFTAIYLTPKLQVHPMKIFMILAFLGASISWINFVNYSWICSLELLFDTTVLIRVHKNQTVTHFYIQWYYFQTSVFFLSALSLNLCVCHDLYAMTAYPFQVHSKRTNTYVIISVIIAIVLSIPEFADQNQLALNQLYLYIRSLVWVVFIICMVLSIGHQIYIARSPSMSTEVIHLLTVRHIVYLVTALICNSFVLVNRILEIVNYPLDPSEWPLSLTIVMAILEVLFYAQGMVIPVTRCLEPYFKMVLQRNFLVCFNCVFRRQINLVDEVVGQGMTPLFTFLNSGMNIELVYVILEGISTQFRQTESDADISICDQQMDSGVDKIIKLSNYTIHNIDLWRNNPSDTLKHSHSHSSRMNSASGQGASLVVNSTVTIRLHSVDLFSKLLCEIDPQILIQSLDPVLNREMVFKAGEGAGKSGSFFFFTHDDRFIIKTMRQGEVNIFLKFLPSYIDHFSKNPQSLLAKIFGVYSVHREGIGRVQIMLMENTLQFKNKQNIKSIYDLKGSTYQRISDQGVLKDLNFMKALGTTVLQDYSLQLSRQLQRDVAFLEKMGLIDYSLLLGVESNQKPIAINQSNRVYADPSFDEQVINQSYIGVGSQKPHSLVDLRMGLYQCHSVQQVDRSSTFVSRYSSMVEDSVVPRKLTTWLPSEIQQCHQFQSQKQLHHIAIIDYLQDYTFAKKCERAVKGVLYNVPLESISVAPPLLYGERFKRFVRQYVIK